MSIFLISLGFICCLVGIVGSFLPVLPGPPLAWLGILLLYIVPETTISAQLLWVTLAISLIIIVLDYVIPILGIKQFGGSKYGMYGAAIGLVVGLFTPVPLGIILFSFLGAYLAEVFISRLETSLALRAAFGSLIGLLASTLVKFFTALVFTFIFTYQVLQYRAVLF